MIGIASPLRKPPPGLSRRQILLLDGLRYAADMADVSYQRLAPYLQQLPEEPSALETATAMLDAWAIVDSSHRFRDLAQVFPGLGNPSWRSELRRGTEDVANLRNCVQHQRGEIEALVKSGEPTWGFLSWVSLGGPVPGGMWRMIAAGSAFPGSQFSYIGPTRVPFRVPPDRVRLHAFGTTVYLWRIMVTIETACKALERTLSEGTIRTRPEDVEDALPWADVAFKGCIEVLVENKRSQYHDGTSSQEPSTMPTKPDSDTTS